MDMLLKTNNTETLFTHAQIYNGRIDFHQSLHTRFRGGRGDIFTSSSKLV